MHIKGKESLKVFTLKPQDDINADLNEVASGLTAVYVQK